MKKLILLISFILLFSSSAYCSIQIGTGAGWSTVSAVDTGTGTGWEQATPAIWNGASWYAMISYADYGFLIACGQSNVPAYGVSSGSPAVTYGIELKTSGTFVNPLDDPCCQNDSPFNIGQGSSWPSFCNQYYANTGKPAIMLILGADATGLTVVGGLGQWWGGANPIYNDAKSRIDSALVNLSNGGYRIGSTIGFIWFQGTTDMLNSVTQSAYYTALDAMFSQIVSDYSSYTFRFYIIKSKYAGTNVRAADDQIATNRADTWVVYDTIDDVGANVYHFTQAAYNNIGVETADGIEGTNP